MTQEFETQVLNINPSEITKKLRQLGAKEEEEVLQKRWVFDIKPCTAKSTGEWVRLRQVGDKKPTITYKNKTGAGITETQELEIEVSDFDQAAEILSRCSFQAKFYQENKRKRFTLNDVEFTIDSWPLIPPYLEIEAKSEKKVQESLKLIELAGKDVGHLGTVTIFDRYGIDLHSFEKLTFGS